MKTYFQNGTSEDIPHFLEEGTGFHIQELRGNSSEKYTYGRIYLTELAIAKMNVFFNGLNKFLGKSERMIGENLRKLSTCT